jgi:hypothetical protein
MKLEAPQILLAGISLESSIKHALLPEVVTLTSLEDNKVTQAV